MLSSDLLLANTIKPRFSVVIPLYNKQNSIINTLTSVLQQKYSPDEIIIVDDGSTDASLELVKQKNIKNLRIIEQHNQGVSVARNNGIKAAKYDYIAFLDADDEWLPLYLDEISILVNKFPSSLMYTCQYQCREQKDQIVDAKIRIDNDIATHSIMDNYFEIASQGDLPFMISGTVVHKSLIDEIGGFPEGEKMGEDQDFFCRSATHQAIAYSKNIHLIYSRDTENRACDNNIPSSECPFSIRLSEHYNNKEKKETIEKSKLHFMKRYSATHLLHLAKININKGNLEQAKKILSDERCKLRVKHYYYLKIKLIIKNITPKTINYISSNYI